MSAEKVEQKLARLKRKIEEVERKVFHTKFSKDPKTLYNELLNHQKKIIDLHKKKRVINQQQYDLLYPTNQETDSNTFDITLLNVLLRSICGFKLNGLDWNQEPPAHDRSLIANLIRLKLARNRIVHLGMAATNNTFYKQIYKYVKQALLDLGCTHNDLIDLVPRPVRFKFTPSIAKFANRDTELSSLHCNVISSKNSNNIFGICLSGLSGIGKTQLVKRYFEKHAAYFEHNVVWIDASDLEESFKLLAHSLHLTITDRHGVLKPIQAIINLVHQYFWEDPVLFVFDNFTFQTNSEQSPNPVTFIPTYPESISIITTQREATNNCLFNMRLDPLSPQSALDYVSGMIDPNSTAEQEINEILEKLGYHPLAIQQFITYTQETRFLPSNYLKLLKEKPEFLFVKEAENSVIDYIRITINKVKDMENRLPYQILQIARFLNCKEMKRGFFLHFFNQDENVIDVETIVKVNEALKILERYALIDISLGRIANSDDEVITMHSLVQQTMTLMLQSDDQELIIFKSILDKFYQHNSRCDNDTTFVDPLGYKYFHSQLMYLFQRTDKHLTETFNRISVHNIPAIFNIFYNCEKIFATSQIFNRIEKMLENDIESDTSCCHFSTNKSQAFLLKLQSYIGQAYYFRGKYWGAYLILNDVRKKQKSLLGLRHKDYLLTTLYYAHCFQYIDRHEEGFEIAKKLYKINSQINGLQHPHTLVSKRCMAINQSFLENISKGVLQTLDNVLEQQIQVHGPTHKQVFATRHEIAKRQIKNRIQALETLLNDLIKAFPDYIDSNDFILRTKYNLGREYLTRGQYGKALEIFDGVYNGWLLKYGEFNEDVREIDGFIKYLKKS